MRHLGIQLIHLLQTQPLRLIYHRVHKHRTDSAARAPDIENLRLEVRIARPSINQVRRRVRDRPVEQPVGGGGHAEAFGAGFQREDLAGHDPGEGTPGRRKKEDVDADESHEGLVRGVRVEC